MRTLRKELDEEDPGFVEEQRDMAEEEEETQVEAGAPNTLGEEEQTLLTGWTGYNRMDSRASRKLEPKEKLKSGKVGSAVLRTAGRLSSGTISTTGFNSMYSHSVPPGEYVLDTPQGLHNKRDLRRLLAWRPLPGRSWGT